MILLLSFALSHKSGRMKQVANTRVLLTAIRKVFLQIALFAVACYVAVAGQETGFEFYNACQFERLIQGKDSLLV